MSFLAVTQCYIKAILECRDYNHIVFVYKVVMHRQSYQNQNIIKKEARI